VTLADFQQQLAKIESIDDKPRAIKEINILIEHADSNVKHQILAYSAIARLYHSENDFSGAIDALDHAISLAATHQLKREEAQAQKMLGVMLYFSGNNPKSLIAYQDALRLYQPLNSPLKVAHLHNNIGLVYAAMGSWSLAMTSYQQAKGLYQEHGSAQDRIDIYFNIAGLYSRLLRFDIAIEMLLKVIEERKNIDDQDGLALAYGDLGNAYRSASNYLQAEYYYKKSLRYYEETQQQYFIASQSHNISEIFNLLNQIEQAEFYATKAIKLGKATGNKYAYVGGLHSLAKAHFHQQKFESAQENISRALLLAKESKMLEQRTEILSLKSLIEAAQFKINDAMMTHRSYVELVNRDKNNLLEDRLVQFQMHQKSESLQQEITKLRQTEDLQKLRLQSIQQQRNFGIIAILLLSVASFFIYRRNVEVKLKKNLALKVAQRTNELELLTKDLQQANQVKSQFMANMSHEIRTPLTSIIGHAQAIVNGEVELAELHPQVDVILANSTHVLSILNDILDLSRIEVNKLEMTYQHHDIHVLVDEVKQLFLEQANKKGLEFYVTHQLPIPLMVNVDRTRLKQIFINLCSNAIKFTHQGKITILLAVNAEQLVFRISDTGIGMKVEQLNEIFKSFTQGDNSISRRFGGSGLGLCLSQQLAVMMNGNISVTSEHNEGSDFTLTLPCIVQQTPPVLSIEKKLMTRTQKLSGKVLLAEDHDDNRHLIARLLLAMGLDVIEAIDGRQAILLCQQHQPDIVLMDIQMPEVDGIDAFKALRSQGFMQPIIALTANAMPHEVDLYLEIGFDDYLAKPIERTQFRATIALYLKQVVASQTEDPLANIDMSDLVQDFVASLPNEYEQLSTLIKAQDYQQIALMVHRLSGAAAMFGFGTMASVSGDIERKIKQQQLDEANDLLKMLLAMISRTSLGANS